MIELHIKFKEHINLSHGEETCVTAERMKSMKKTFRNKKQCKNKNVPYKVYIKSLFTDSDIVILQWAIGKSAVVTEKV